ncbi:MAG: protein kinase [Sandaracinaceae bacterium]
MRHAARRPELAVPIGATIAGRYVIEEMLGEGGMAQVYRAREAPGERRVAVKVLHPEIAANREAAERTKREGQLLSSLDNPAIVSVESYGELDDGTVFLVMELLEGETLGARMRRGPLEAAELTPIVAGTCAGLHAAHRQGIIHRDLKPDNIFLCPTDMGLQVKLLDFGISKVYGESKLTQTGEILGTPRYMSPEQLGAEPDVDGRVDVYALGVILYEALAGKPPFLASTPTDLIVAILNGKVVPLTAAQPDVSPAVEEVVMRAMSKTRAARYETSMDLARAFIDAAGGTGVAQRQQRRGMPTRALGSEVRGDAATALAPAVRPPAEPAAADGVAGKLQIGTFSGLREAVPTGANTVPGKKLPPTRSPDEPLTPPKELPLTRESEAFDPPASIPTTNRPPPPERSVPRTSLIEVSLPGTFLPSAPSHAGPPPRVEPSLGARVALVVGALLAGAASAGAVVLALQSMKDDRDPSATETPSAVTDPATNGATHADGATDETPDAIPEGQDPAPDVQTSDPDEDADDTADEEETEEPTARPTGRRRRRSTETQDQNGQGASTNPVLPGFGGSGSNPSGGHTETPPPSTNPLDQARAAQRAGDPQRCVQILDEAIQSGASAIALRRRGDCYEAAGNREAAIRDYQRFCRLVPDHPSITEVRPLLASWGRTCP